MPDGSSARNGAVTSQNAMASAARSAPGTGMLHGRRLRWAAAGTVSATDLRTARLFPVPGAKVGADGVHAVEVLGDEVGIFHRDPELLPEEHREPEHAQRVQDARLKQRRRVAERQQGHVLDELPGYVVVNDCFHAMSFPAGTLSVAFRERCPIGLCGGWPGCHD